MVATLELGNGGERHNGTVESELAVLRGWSWPYTVVHGAHDGPRTTVTAGIHGCEYVSIYAAMRLARELDPAEVMGQVVVVPVVNLPSYWERTAFVGPYDGKNLNRLFPGKSTGTFSEALAYFAFNTFILPNDAYIDLHGGDLVEDLAPFAGYLPGTDPAVEERSRAMADAFGLSYIISRFAGASAPTGLTFTAAAERGVASVLAEAGGCGQLTLDDVELLVAGTRRALTVAGNLAGDPTPPQPSRHLDQSEHVAAGCDGFWICDVQAGDHVSEGQELGRILGIAGELRDTVTAQRDGVITVRTTSAAVKKGGMLFSLGS